MITLGVKQKVFPQFLNKYRSNSAFTKRIITASELYFCNPLEFNDPYDCNTPINRETPLEDVKNWLKLFAKADDAVIDELATRIQNDPSFMEKETKKTIAKTGICCFSTLDDSILQWSHYSEYHRGMCFKFDITQDTEFFYNPLIVHYKNVMQHYNHFSHRDKIVEYLVQAKFSDWSYESEVRVVKPEIGETNRLLKFKDPALLEIIFGTNTPLAVMEEYMELCRKHKPHIRFFKMKLSSGLHYGLEKHAL